MRIINSHFLGNRGLCYIVEVCVIAVLIRSVKVAMSQLSLLLPYHGMETLARKLLRILGTNHTSWFL